MTLGNVVGLLFLAVMVSIVLCAWLARNDDIPPDLDRCEPDERQKRLQARQKAVREFMKREGIKSLMDGRPAWARINPMGDVPVAEKVTPIRKARR